MAGNSPLSGFVDEWIRYLALRDHRIWEFTDQPDVLRSRNGKGTAYRWLLLRAKHATRRLTPIERENIVRELRNGQQMGEQVFVVVRFDRPQGKVIAYPAAMALQAGRLRSNKGGIPWD